MPILFFSFFIIIISVINFFASKASRKDKEKQDAFWAKEGQANSVPKQDISLLPYITLEEDLFCLHFEDEVLTALEAQVLSYKGKKILNLTGVSNTDLKLLYGSTNLPFLTQCDENFTNLCKLIFDWGKALIDTGHINEARTVLEYGIHIGSDITGNYTVLAHLYLDQKASYKIDELLSYAQSLNSLSKDTIILKLKELVHPN